MRFSGKKVIITGGTSGLGAASVLAFCREGADVFFCGLIDQEADKVLASAAQLPGQASYLRADVRRDADMRDFVAQATKKGGLDIAVNSAGIQHSAARFHQQDLAITADVMATNFMGIWHAMRHEIGAMLAHNTAPMAPGQNRGVILNIASVLSLGGAEWMSAYGASKHAMVGLTKSAALDYAESGIRINALSPGPMDTPMLQKALDDIKGDMSKYAGGFPEEGPAKAEEVAEKILGLCDGSLGEITGCNITLQKEELSIED